MSGKLFEEELQTAVREVARRVTEWAYNQVQPASAAELPHDVTSAGSGYRRLNRKTANRHVATLFGKITLWRHGYRSWHRDDGEPAIFPLEIDLGLIEGATPALASATGTYLAEGGATQEKVLARIHSQHGVNWGVKKLRDLAATLAGRMDEARHDAQVHRLHELLQQASDSDGNRKPVLAVGRDGITLATRPHGFYEVATSATLSVYDRSGKRLGTVYLAYVPELGQGTMTDQLTRLVRGVLADWYGPLPRLCYVTDAGEQETAYYRKVLRGMRHPRTGERLNWQWIVDYYHATERITVLSEAIAGWSEREAAAWAARMRKLLLKPGGPRRVLLSAAAMRSRCGLRRGHADKFRRAYNYIRHRTRFMRYSEFKHWHLPIGSGITEAACKTLFTQRLKLSGMRWEKVSAQWILNLRVVLLSGVWGEVFTSILVDTHNMHHCRPYELSRAVEPSHAA